MHSSDSEDEVDSLNRDESPSIQKVISSLIRIDFTYITVRWIGRVKLLEFICTIFAGSLLPSTIGFFFTRFSFYIFVIWTSFMYITVDLFINLTSLNRMLPSVMTSADLMFFPLLIGAFSLLISCSLVAGTIRFYSEKSYKLQLGFSVLFGFILMTLFILEAVLRHQEAKRGPREDYEDGGTKNSEKERKKRMEISGPIFKPVQVPPYDANFSNNENIKPYQPVVMGDSNGNNDMGGEATPIGYY